MQSLALWVVLSGVAFAYAGLVYSRREIPVRGRRWLAVLRGSALAILILVLLNPSLPGGPEQSAPRILVDRSGSMASVDSVRLAQAVEEARRREGAGAVVVELEDGSRLAPSLAAAVEGGAASVTVISDLRASDPVAAEAVVRGSRTPVRWVDVGRRLDNAGISALEVSSGALAGDPLSGSVRFIAESASGDGPLEVAVNVRVATGSSFDTTVTATPGRSTRVAFTVEGPVQPGTHLVEATVSLAGDVFPGDDTFQALVDTGPGGGDVVLVSFEPDWEPRFLLPTLGEVTGLAVQGFLSLAEAGFLRTGGSAGVAQRAEVRSALAQARLVVYQGTVPSWAEGAPLPGTPVVRLPGPVSSTGMGGEWYLSPDIPASPIAAELVGISVLGLPPVSMPPVLPARSGRAPAPEVAPPTGTPVLLVQLAGRGDAVAALLLEDDPDRRQAHAVARGFWRWGFRDGEGREVYRRLWSGVAGWLLSGSAQVGGSSAAGPVANWLPPGEESEWRFPQAAGGEVLLTFSPDTAGSAEEASQPVGNVAAGRGEASAPVDVQARVDSLGRARIDGPAASGVYLWTAEFSRAGDTLPPASGKILVGEPELDLLHPRAVSLLTAGEGEDGAGSPRPGRPLRTHPVPYLLLLVLLSAEWVGRRRSGLR